MESPELRAVDSAVGLLRIALCAYRVKVSNPNSDIATCAAKVVNHASAAIPMPGISGTFNHILDGWIKRDSFTDCPAKKFEQRLRELDEYHSFLRDYCDRHQNTQKNPVATENLQKLTRSFLREFFNETPTLGDTDERQTRKSYYKALSSDNGRGKLLPRMQSLVECMLAGLQLRPELERLQRLLDDRQNNARLAAFFEETMEKTHDEMTKFMQKRMMEVKRKTSFFNKANLKLVAAAQNEFSDEFRLIWESHADSVTEFGTRLEGENQLIAYLIESYTDRALGLIPLCLSETAIEKPPYWKRFLDEIRLNLLERSRDGILLFKKVPLPVFQSSYVKAVSVLLLGLNRVCEDGNLLQRLLKEAGPLAGGEYQGVDPTNHSDFHVQHQGNPPPSRHVDSFLFIDRKGNRTCVWTPRLPAFGPAIRNLWIELCRAEQLLALRDRTEAQQSVHNFRMCIWNQKPSTDDQLIFEQLQARLLREMLAALLRENEFTADAYRYFDPVRHALKKAGVQVCHPLATPFASAADVVQGAQAGFHTASFSYDCKDGHSDRISLLVHPASQNSIGRFLLNHEFQIPFTESEPSRKLHNLVCDLLKADNETAVRHSVELLNRLKELLRCSDSPESERALKILREAINETNNELFPTPKQLADVPQLFEQQYDRIKWSAQISDSLSAEALEVSAAPLITTPRVRLGLPVGSFNDESKTAIVELFCFQKCDDQTLKSLRAVVLNCLANNDSLSNCMARWYEKFRDDLLPVVESLLLALGVVSTGDLQNEKREIELNQLIPRLETLEEELSKCGELNLPELSAIRVRAESVRSRLLPAEEVNASGACQSDNIPEDAPVCFHEKIRRGCLYVRKFGFANHPRQPEVIVSAGKMPEAVREHNWLLNFVEKFEGNVSADREAQRQWARIDMNVGQPKRMRRWFCEQILAGTAKQVKALIGLIPQEKVPELLDQLDQLFQAYAAYAERDHIGLVLKRYRNSAEIGPNYAKCVTVLGGEDWLRKSVMICPVAERKDGAVYWHGQVVNLEVVK